MSAMSTAETARMLAEEAPDQTVSRRAIAAFVLARYHAWEGVDNLAVSRRLLFQRWLVRSRRLQGDTMPAWAYDAVKRVYSDLEAATAAEGVQG